MRTIVLFVLVCLLSITAVSVWAAVDANAGVCPKMTTKQQNEIVKHYKQVFPGKTVSGYWQVTQHDPNAQYIVRIYDWPRLVHTVIIPVKNPCATRF